LQVLILAIPNSALHHAFSAVMMGTDMMVIARFSTWFSHQWRDMSVLATRFLENSSLRIFGLKALHYPGQTHVSNRFKMHSLIHAQNKHRIISKAAVLSLSSSRDNWISASCGVASAEAVSSYMIPAQFVFFLTCPQTAMRNKRSNLGNSPKPLIQGGS